MTSTPQKAPRVLLSIILVVVLIGGGVGAARVLYALREAPPRKDTEPPVPVVNYIRVQKQDVVEQFAGFGTVRADRTVRLAAEVTSTVTELVDDLEAGSRVEAGQLLILLDDREYLHAWSRAKALIDADRAALEEQVVQATQTQSLLATAEQELRVTYDEKKRVADLFEQGQAAKKEFDFANLAYQQARRVKQGYEMELAMNAPRQARLEASIRGHEAEAALAELNVRRCEIRAPIAGTIDELAVELGSHASPGMFLLSIIDPARVEVPIQLPASVYDRVRAGAPCRLTSESMPEVGWSGRVQRLGVKADEQTRTFSVFVDVDNTEQPVPLIPGAFVRAEVEGPIYYDRLLVPRGAVRDGSVLVSVRDVIERRLVSIERFIGEDALVKGSLGAGDCVVLSHLDQLEPGARIRLSVDEAAPDSHADARAGSGAGGEK